MFTNNKGQYYMESNTAYKKRMAERHNKEYVEAKEAAIKAENTIPKRVARRSRRIGAGILGAVLALGSGMSGI